MIRRLRAAAPMVLICGAAVLVSLTAVAQAVTVSYVTTGEMHRFVVATFLGGAGAILGGLAVVYAMLDKAKGLATQVLITAVSNQVSENAKQIGEILDLFKAHHLDPDAHPAGSRARLDPITVKLDILTEKLTTLIAQHEAIQEQGGGICAALREARQLAAPQPKRDNDPHGFDGRALRGRA